MKVGDKLFVRDAYIEAPYMVEQATIVEIAYHPNSTMPMVYLLQFENFKSHWFHTLAVKEM